MRHTVAIPAYRRPAELLRALDALAKQERRVEEILVITRNDDFPTQEIVAAASKSHPIILKLVERPGVIEAYNTALDCATGDVISFIDDDAVPHADWAARIIDAFEKEINLVGLGGKDRVFINGKLLEGAAGVVGIVTWYGRTFGNHNLGYGSKREVDSLKGVNMSFRKTALGALRMDSRLRGTGAQWHCELNLCLQLRAQGKRLIYDPNILVDHFPAQRHDDDQRDRFNALAYENQIHNLTLSLLEYLRPPGRIMLLTYALTIGIANNYCGILKGVVYCARVGPRGAWQKTVASARGVCAAWLTWKKSKRGRGSLAKNY